MRARHAVPLHFQAANSSVGAQPAVPNGDHRSSRPPPDGDMLYPYAALGAARGRIGAYQPVVAVPGVGAGSALLYTRMIPGGCPGGE